MLAVVAAAADALAVPAAAAGENGVLGGAAAAAAGDVDLDGKGQWEDEEGVPSPKAAGSLKES